MFCLHQSLSLEESINLLSSNEKPTVQESTTNARDQSRERRDGRGNRGHSGTSGSGYQSRESSRNQGFQSQSYSNRSQSNSEDKVEKPGSGPLCYWCKKRGHRQKDCQQYLATKKKDRQTEKKEQADNIAIAKDEYNSSLYLPEQAMTVTSAAVQ
jgi:hypothetical protein